MKQKNDLVAMLLVSCLLEQIAKVKGMQTRLRSYYTLNGRYFRRDHLGKTDLNHAARMVFGLANELSEKQFMEVWMNLGKRVFVFYTVFEDFLSRKKH